jgi:DNA repair protein RecO (recombination protein O)
MKEEILVSGMVLACAPAGEYDRRVTLLTKERGKITAFARGARRPTSPLLGVTSTFAFAVFHLREGRSAYNLREAELIAYFDRLREDLESVCYASYFAEFAGYYSKENLTDSALLNLLYKTFQALEKKQISNQLIRAVYELKLMVINGEYSALPPISTGDAATYAWDYVVQASIDKLYTFDLQKRALSEFIEAVSFLQRQIVDRQFYSLDILEQMQ